MVCCGQRDKPKKLLTLAFAREQLLYDIANCAYVTGDRMGAAGADVHVPHVLIDVAQDGNVDRVTRVLDLVHAEVKEMLYPYCKTGLVSGMRHEDTLRETGEYIIEMHVPDAFSATTGEYLEQLVHEYMVCRVLADWTAVTAPEWAEKWMVQAEDIRERIRDCLNTRMGRVRRTLSPF